jgi:CRISPR system Cascade subunit CasE
MEKMMYLSRLILDPRNREVRRDLANCHDLHSRILCAFPQSSATDGNARAHFGVLYRVETDARSGDVQVIVQSAEVPDWLTLPSGYLADLRGHQNPECKDISAAYQGISAGMVLRFRLRANPTRRIARGGKSRDTLAGKRVELQTEEEWNAWITRKGELGGFHVLDVTSKPDSPLERWQAAFSVESVNNSAVRDMRITRDLKVIGQKRGAQGKRLTFGSVLFEGRLRVTDADRLRASLINGIGSGKAYGFGLVSIGRAN